MVSPDELAIENPLTESLDTSDHAGGADRFCNASAFLATVFASSDIGIDVTTHNRPVVSAEAIGHHLEHLPEGARLVVVDDGSTLPAQVPDGVELIRHETVVGIAAAKNACLAGLDGCESVFLFDDDAWHVNDGWQKPYIDPPEPHVMCMFEDLATNNERRASGYKAYFEFRPARNIVMTSLFTGTDNPQRPG